MIRTLHRLLVSIVLLPVVFYRRVLSPMKRAPSCIYLPTCSEYAMVAVQQRGIVVGSALALARILRCNPLFHGGYDPVPGAVSARRCAHHVEEQH
jgi:putative membrane protein insertion efficiency factor